METKRYPALSLLLFVCLFAVHRRTSVDQYEAKEHQQQEPQEPQEPQEQQP